MEAFIVKLISMSLQASIAILVVIVARLVFGLFNIPKKYAYLLWIIPFIRLAIPFAIESDFSIIPEVNNKDTKDSYVNEYAYEPEYNQPIDIGYGETDEYYVDDVEDTNVIHNGVSNNISDNYDSIDNGDFNEEQDIDGTYYVYTGGSGATNINQELENLDGDIKDKGMLAYAKPGFIIWYIGVATLIMLSAVSYIRLRKKLCTKVKVCDNVYMCDYIDTAFVIGSFKPYICIPSDIEEDKHEYVIAHESYHIKRKDYLVKTVYFIITVVHWFNPLVWLAYFLMERDMEMSCDEAVLYKLGMNNKKEYANTLLTLSTDRSNPISMPIAFGEGSTKGRIKNIMKSKKPVVLVIIVAVVVIVGLGLVLLTDPKEQKERPEDIATATDADAITDQSTNTDASVDSTNIHDTEANLDNEESITLVSGQYRYVPEGETLEEAMLYAPYIIINSELQEISIVEGAGSYIIQYGKYTTYEETANLSFWSGGDMYYHFKIVDGNLVVRAESTTISYAKEAGGEYYDVPEGGVFEFVPGSEFDVGDLFEGYSHASFANEYPDAIEIDIEQPEYVDFQGLGTDGPILDYADMKFVIFHGYKGLYVYDRVAGGIRGAVNLEPIGCHYNEGDNACEVTVGNNGYRVYLTIMNSDVAYVYDVQYNQLFQVDKTYVEAQERTKPTLVTDEVFEDDYTTWQSYNCVEITDGNTTYYGCLFSGSGLWEDISFSERNEEGRRRFNLIREYNDLIEGEERRTRLAEIKDNRQITSVQEMPDYDLYDKIIENHNIAREQDWSIDDMIRNGLVTGATGARYDGYAIMDITGDGVDELIVGCFSQGQSVILGVYTIKDGKIQVLLSGIDRSVYYLCEDNVLMHKGSSGASKSVTQFFYLDDVDKVTFLEGIIYDGNYNGKHGWYYSTKYNSYHSYQGQPVTKEYAMDILTEYSIRDINFTYFESTEVSETIPYFSPEEDEAKHAFGTMMEDWSAYPDVEEVMGNIGSAYCGYYDIDDDGVVELIINSSKGMGIFKYENSEIKRIYYGPYADLLEDGTVMYWRRGGAPVHEVYKYYVYDGEEYVEEDDFTWYNNDEGVDYSTSEDDNYFYNGELISQDEWNELKAPYEELEFSKKQNMFVIYIE